MKNVIISNDKFLAKGIISIGKSVNYKVIPDVRGYITDFSDARKIVFVDDRVKNINLLSVRNSYRGRDVFVIISFGEKSLLTNFSHHSINVSLPLIEFQKSISEFFQKVEMNDNKIDKIDKIDYLTPRQAEVISALLSGMNIGAICSYFSTNRKNIANYNSILTKKYGCRNFVHFYKNFIA